MSTEIIDKQFQSLALTWYQKKIIVAVDYGTTFTGASYVNSESGSISDIVLIKSWPGTRRDVDHALKAPSHIAYPEDNQKLGKRRWGFQVEAGHKCYSWTKLLLDQNIPLTKYDDPMLEKASKLGIMQLPEGKDAVDVVADFLMGVYEHIMHTLEKGLTKEILDISAIEFWFTMPAIWSDKAQASTREAAQRAGFGQNSSRPGDKIFMITEPEAAAIAALTRSKTDVVSAPVKAGDGVLVCDCGGGTVDITTYLITGTDPILSFEELCTGTGGKCGSTALDRNFYLLMSKRFGDAFDELSMKKKGPGSEFMGHFERLKKDFGADTIETTYEMALNMRSSDFDPKYYDDDEGVVLISDQDLRDIFDPVINQILDLIRTQIEDANKELQRDAINRIILVGGFGDSEYLLQAVRRTFGGDRNISITVPSNPQATIAQGAALRGLQGIRSMVKICRRHYGSSWAAEFRPGIDNEKHAYWDKFDQRKRAAGRMNWMIRKGQKYHENDSQKVSIGRKHYPGDSLEKHIKLYCCDPTEAPDRVEHPSVQVVGRIETDFTNVDLSKFSSKFINGQRVYLLEYSLEVTFGAQEGILKFEAVSNGQVIGKSSISFHKASYY